MHRLALAGLLASSSAASAAPCEIVENHPVVLTASGAVIGDGGGIVVGTAPDYQHASKLRSVAELRFADKSAPAIKHLAPGLDLLVVATAAATLESAGHEKLVSVGHGKVRDLGAPDVTAVVHTAPQATKHPYVMIDAEVGDAPAGVLALIVFDEAGATARSWGRVTANAKTVTVFSQGGCGIPVAGTLESRIGDKVRLAWVDAAGRISKLSSVVVVQ
jgi:hypothetical protein